MSKKYHHSKTTSKTNRDTLQPLKPNKNTIPRQLSFQRRVPKFRINKQIPVKNNNWSYCEINKTAFKRKLIAKRGQQLKLRTPTNFKEGTKILLIVTNKYKLKERIQKNITEGIFKMWNDVPVDKEARRRKSFEIYEKKYYCFNAPLGSA